MSKVPDKEQLSRICGHLIDNVFRNDTVMYSDFVWSETTPDVVSMIASLYNMLYLAITGEEYDYFHHWCNKIGANCEDDYFSFIFRDGDSNES